MSAGTAAVWPEGVIARYLTVGGATVDLRHDATYIGETEPSETIATCSACAALYVERWQPYADRRSSGSEDADREAGIWAQAHAETCRAMPKPGVAA